VQRRPSRRRLAAAALLACASCTSPGTPEAPTEAGSAFVPVYEHDFPDPFVLEDRGSFMAYSTNSAGINLPMAVSNDLIRWRPVEDPGTPGTPLDGMPSLASWVKEGRTWAPEVMRVGGRWLLYYTAHDRKTDLQCIGVAVAAGPRGPFRDEAARPLVCQTEGGGTIDAQPFRDADGQLYLYYKNDGNNPRVLVTSRIWAQRLSPDGLRLIGEAVPLVRNDTHWEWRVVEAPAMVRSPGGYTLFFSGNHFGWEADQRLSNYAIGYARCAGPMGPCTDAPENPILGSGFTRDSGCLSGPGHPTVIVTSGRSYIAFHAWAATAECRKAADRRYLYVAPLNWRGATPVIAPSLRTRRN
jgi:beta-xylosidase